MAGPLERDPQDGPRTPRLADPTRDIRLPPLPGRPGPELPSDWERVRSERQAAAEAAGSASPPAVETSPVGAAHDAEARRPMVDQPTDELGRPPHGARDRTITFQGTAAQRWAAGHPATPDPAWSSVPPGPAPVVAPRSRPAQRSRRWPWVLLTLVPIVVIVVTGVWLLVLMRG